MEHTKGPWNVFDGPNGNLWIGPEEFFSIAEVRNGASDREYGGKKAERANAKLIAAAPELLEACANALKYDAAIFKCANDPKKMSSFCSAEGEDLDALYEAWITSARKAIAKAES